MNKRDGKYVIASHMDTRKSSSDAEVIAVASPGNGPEVFANSPNRDCFDVGNDVDKDLQVFKFNNIKTVQVRLHIKLPGHPASMRGVAR